jgi:CheY-like chemotaxis protein
MKGLAKKSILVVDDDLAMLRALEKVLKSEGAAVTCAAWGGDAIEILTRRKKSIDLVITDLRMPFVSGMTVVYGINQIFPALPIIVLTAFGTPHLEEECRKQGAAALFEKPLNTPQLLAAIESVLAPQPADRNCHEPA